MKQTVDGISEQADNKIIHEFVLIYDRQTHQKNLEVSKKGGNVYV